MVGGALESFDRGLHAGPGSEGTRQVPRRSQVAFLDKTLACRNCEAEFVFTAGEQEFYEQHGLAHEPSRCQ